MRRSDDTSLLCLLWSVAGWPEGCYRSTDGREIEVVDAGEVVDEESVALGARVKIDGCLCSGAIALGDERADVAGVIARFTTERRVVMLDSSGTQLPVVQIEIDDEVRRMYNRLRCGASHFYCGERLREMDSLHRSDLFTGLVFDRIARKNGDIEKIFNDCQKDWNQTLYVMLFRVMGDVRNREAYMELARRVPYRIIQREREAARAAEAMLLCASGLLDQYEDDDYLHRLKADFFYLSHKYNIEPMRASQWTLTGVLPRNHPVLRLSQMASLLCSSELLFSKVIDCCTADDVSRLFMTEAADYWTTHYIPARQSANSVKRLGRSKAHLIGINLVAPMQFFYSARTGREELRTRAVELLESIPAEDNRFIRSWQGEGVPVQSAFDTQALLQLFNEYCAEGRCCACRLGRRLIKKSVKK